MLHLISTLKYMVMALCKPTVISRFIDKDGRKKIVVINRTLFGGKSIGKFEISQEFAPDSYCPNWKPIQFIGADLREKDG